MAEIINLPTVPHAMSILLKLGDEVASAETSRDLMNILNASEALRRAFRPVRDVSDKAGEVSAIAETRLARELAKLPKATGRLLVGKIAGTSKGTGGGKGSSSGSVPSPLEEKPPTLKELGIDKKRSARARKLATVSESKRNEYIRQLKDEGKAVTPDSILGCLVAEKRAAKETEREAKRAENRKKVAIVASPQELLGDARFSTVTLDPPWDWGDEGDDDQHGRARPTYKTMGIDEIANLPVEQFADKDCHLYLWITNRSLPKGFGLIEKWGFRYITCLTWAKPSFGMGNYFRGQSEQILFAVKGSLALRRKNVGTVFSWPRGRGGHSSKPLEFYDMVESCSPGPYLEYFSRSKRKDWMAWGEDSSADAAAA